MQNVMSHTNLRGSRPLTNGVTVRNSVQSVASGSLRGLLVCSSRPRFARNSSPRSVVRAAADQEKSKALVRALSGDLDESPFLEPFVRSFILGVATGALLEGSHVALQVLAGNFPGVSQYSPLLVADHVTAFASWIALYAAEAIAVMAVLKRFNFDTSAANKELRNLSTITKKMMPIGPRDLMKRLVGVKKTPITASQSVTETVDVLAAQGSTSDVEAPAEPMPRRVERPQGLGSIAPLPRRPAPQKPPGGDEDKERATQHAKRAKELHDRSGYLKNMWYAAALSEKVKKEPVKVQLCGKEMVLFREEDTGRVHCIDNACPHRGAPLSGGSVEKKEGHTCVVCPYHHWALDGEGALRDVPAAATKGEWPKRALVDSYPVEEKGGFIWLFYGSKSLPADARPPIPFVPELEDKAWKAVYEEMEFECNHFGVFENAIDMAHIHYLHGDSFGNSGKPEIRDMTATTDAYSATSTFKIHNKPVNAFWALFQVPSVEVTATAFLPSTSVVSFTLANGLSFITFVSTTPISKDKCINRFALVRNLSWDKSGIFNARLWDQMARDAMIKIQLEDKAMVEQLRYDQLPAEYSVRADLPQVAFRKLRQQWADMVGVVPTEDEQPPYTISNRNM